MPREKGAEALEPFTSCVKKQCERSVELWRKASGVSKLAGSGFPLKSLAATTMALATNE